MKNFLKKILDVRKYKRLANTYKLKYESVLEEKIKDKTELANLQKKVILLQDKIIDYKNIVKEYKEKEYKNGKKN